MHRPPLVVIEAYFAVQGIILLFVSAESTIIVLL